MNTVVASAAKANISGKEAADVGKSSVKTNSNERPSKDNFCGGESKGKMCVCERETVWKSDPAMRSDRRGVEQNGAKKYPNPDMDQGASEFPPFPTPESFSNSLTARNASRG